MANAHGQFNEPPPPYSEKYKYEPVNHGDSYPPQPAYNAQYPSAPPAGPPEYPIHAAPAQAHTTVVMAPMTGTYCTNCQQNAMVESNSTCALILIIIVAVMWFPMGLCAFLLLPAAKIRRCLRCGHTVNKPMTAVYCCFGFAVISLVVLIAGFVTLYAVLFS